MSKISVITVCYNCVENIEATIQSVLAQDHNLIEFIVIDGGSTDGTVEIIKKYIDKITNFRSEDDLGIYDAMNKGIKIASGDWIIFLNAGDVFHPDFRVTELSFNWLDSIEFVCFPFLVDGDYALTMPVYQAKTCLPSSHQATLISTKIAKATPFNIEYKVAADFDQYKYRNSLSDGCVYIESLPIAHVMAGGYSAENIGTLRKEYLRIIYRYDGFIFALIWYVRNRRSIFKLIKLLIPSRIFCYLKKHLI